MVPEDEKRRFQRLLVTLPVEYVAFHPESGERHQGEGQLRDFSLGGLFFHTQEPGWLQPGHILELTITMPLAPLGHFDSSRLQVQAEILRLEEPSPENRGFGVAVSFLELPSFLSPATQMNSAD